jgi:hypothetical protein
MKKNTPKRKRPAVLVRFYPEDLARLNEVCQAACTPRENYIRRVVLLSIDGHTPGLAKRKVAV